MNTSSHQVSPAAETELQNRVNCSDESANQNAAPNQSANERRDKNLPTDEQLETMKENIATYVSVVLLPSTVSE